MARYTATEPTPLWSALLQEQQKLKKIHQFQKRQLSKKGENWLEESHNKRLKE